jgi:precorrin-3B C17-methyltransferase
MPILDARPEMADMRTVVLVGSSHTRKIKRKGVKMSHIYTPRYYGDG